jgi:hypothetical protein
VATTRFAHFVATTGLPFVFVVARVSSLRVLADLAGLYHFGLIHGIRANILLVAKLARVRRLTHWQPIWNLYIRIAP